MLKERVKRKVHCMDRVPGSLHLANRRASSLLLHVHNLPHIATLPIILRTRIARPPVLVHRIAIPILHIWSQDHRDPALALGILVGRKVRSGRIPH